MVEKCLVFVVAWLSWCYLRGRWQGEAISPRCLVRLVSGDEVLCFLDRESREEQLWESCLHRQCFGFVQGQLQQVGRHLDCATELGHKGLFHPLDLGEDLPAGRQVKAGGGWIGAAMF